MKWFVVVLLIGLLSACTQNADSVQAAPEHIISGTVLTFEVEPTDTFQTYEIYSPGPRMFEKWRQNTQMKIEQDKWDSWIRKDDSDTLVVGTSSVEHVASQAGCERKAACY